MRVLAFPLVPAQAPRRFLPRHPEMWKPPTATSRRRAAPLSRLEAKRMPGQKSPRRSDGAKSGFSFRVPRQTDRGAICVKLQDARDRHELSGREHRLVRIQKIERGLVVVWILRSLSSGLCKSRKHRREQRVADRFELTPALLVVSGVTIPCIISV